MKGAEHAVFAFLGAVAALFFTEASKITALPNFLGYILEATAFLTIFGIIVEVLRWKFNIPEEVEIVPCPAS